MPPSVLRSKVVAVVTTRRFQYPGIASILVAVIIGLTNSPIVADDEATADNSPIRRIAFGSCLKQSQPQPIWDRIVAFQPQVFVWLGDNIYGDTEDMDVMASKWALLKSNEGYTRLRSRTRVLGTWDDHDFGENDAGREYPRKKETQQLLLDFLDEPVESDRRRRNGVYDSVVLGQAPHRVQVILLDTRYFRSPLRTNDLRRTAGVWYPGPYAPDESDEAELLGTAQWEWLESQLLEPAELRIVASSIQVIPNEHSWEKWGNFPRERHRLFQLLKSSGASGVVLVSGDRHFAEVSRLDSVLPYPVYELTASSLNQPGSKGNVDEPNKSRVGPAYHESNFGFMTIEWTGENAAVILGIQDLTGTTRNEVRIPLADLRVPQ